MPAEKFMAIFAGLERAHGKYELNGTSKGNKAEGKGSTILGPVTLELWQRHLDGKLGVGIIPIRDDGTVVWGAIDVDVYDLDLPKLELECSAMGLPLILCRTKSGGAHLYLFCKEPMKATVVRSKLTQFASALGYVGVEIYPKQTELASDKDVGNWLNMPYFGGKDTNRYALLGGSPLEPEQFLDLVDKRMVNEEELKAISPVINDDFQDGPPCLQMMSRGGFPEGHRNNSLYSLGVYCKAKYGDEWESVIDRMNQDYMNPPLASKEVAALVKGLSKKDGFFYKCKQPPLCNHCNKELCREREFGIASNDDSPGVMFDNLTKIQSADPESTDPPVWIVSLEGRRLIINTDELMDQMRFNKKCVEKLNKMLRIIKPAAWRVIIQELLNNVEIIEAPVDAGPEGRFWLLLEHFCTGRAQARTKDEIKLSKPWTGYKDGSPIKDGDRKDAYHFFRLSDLTRFLDQQRYRDLKEREIWTLIRRRGGFHGQWNIKGTCVQWWAVPAFDVQIEDYDVPEMEKERF